MVQMQITYSKGIATVTLESPLSSSTVVDNLPASLLVEIFCRLPWKFVLRCRCVCKSWSALICDPEFTSQRALYLQKHRVHNEDQRLLFVRWSYFKDEFFTITKQTTHLRFEPLNFLPQSLLDLDYLHVRATYNDLILLSTIMFPLNRCYYICNLYSKEWVAVRPGPPLIFHRPYIIVTEVGFILDAEYRCRIVHLFVTDDEAEALKVMMFVSETGEWIEQGVRLPQRLERSVQLVRSAVAYKGTLYWLFKEGIVIGLDPFELNTNYYCSLVSSPNHVDNSDERCGYIDDWLGVSKGSLMLCRLYEDTRASRILYMWEMTQEQVDDDDDSDGDGVGRSSKVVMNWSLKKRVVLEFGSGPNTILKKLRSNPHLLILDPDDEDVLYLAYVYVSNGRRGEYIVVYNIRTLEIIVIRDEIVPVGCRIQYAYPVLPYWQSPTPVPKLRL